MTVPNTFQTGVAIRASDLNGNFTDLDTRFTNNIIIDSGQTVATKIKLRSANGTIYDVTVSNAGALTVTAA
jgi:hypothetical protein